MWPAAVEAVLGRHPGIAEAMVVGRPDPEWGHVVTAVVVPADAVQPPRLEELREYVRAELPPYCAPKVLDVVAELPRTTTGKVKRPAQLKPE